MEDKCFCHFNGFRVKDAEARARIEALEQNAGSGESKGYYTYDLPLGLCPTRNDSEWFSTDLPVESYPILKEIINKLKADNVTRMTLVLNNTSKNVEFNGEIFENPSPEQVLFDEFLIIPASEDGEPTIYSFDGIERPSRNSNGQMSYETKVMLTVNEDSNGEIIHASISQNTLRYLPIGNEEEYTPSGDYNPATKKYVDDALAGAGGGSEDIVYPLHLPVNQIFGVASSINCTDAATLEKLSNIINNSLDKPCINLYITTDGADYDMVGRSTGCMFVIKNSKVNLSTHPTQFTVYGIMNYMDTNNKEVDIKCLSCRINGSWNGDTFTCTQIYITDLSTLTTLDSSKALSKTNVSPYEVTKDYHPAHKKYVDDTVKQVESSGTFTVTDDLGGAISGADATYQLTMIGKIGMCSFRVKVPASTYYAVQCNIPNNPELVNGGANATYGGSDLEYILAAQRLDGGVSEFAGWVMNKSEVEKYVVQTVIFAIK